MSRQLIDGVIIVAVLVLCATHLYAQGMGGKRVLQPSQPAAVHAGAARNAPANGPGRPGTIGPGSPGGPGAPGVHRGAVAAAGSQQAGRRPRPR